MRPPYVSVLLALVLALPAAGCADDPARVGPEGTAPGASGREIADRLILGGTLVTMDASRRVIVDGGLAIRHGAIVAVDAAARIEAGWTAEDTIRNGPHDLVVPGLINGHNHAAMVLLRGVADDLALMDWLENYIFPAEAQTVTPEMVAAGTRLAAMEMIATGTTTFVDMYYFMEEAARVVDEVGMRALVGETVIGFPAPDHGSPEEALAWSEGFLERWAGHPRVIAALAPHAPYTVAPDVLRRTAELARAHDAPILIHLAETTDEVDTIASEYQTTPTGHLDRLGLLGPDLVGAHGVWLDDGDIALLAQRGAAIVHNPESNMKLASGAARVPALLAAGVAVGIGTDGAASNNDLDLFDALSLASFLQKLTASDPTALPADQVFAMATIGGARALGIADRVGSLEPGKRADVVVLDGDAPSLVPRYDVYSHLVYAASGGHVKATLVDGVVLYRDGAHLTLDADATREAAWAIAARVRSAVGAGAEGADD